MDPRVTDPPARLHPADFLSQLGDPFGVVTGLPLGADFQEAIDLLKLDVRRVGLGSRRNSRFALNVALKSFRLCMKPAIESLLS